ncbi:predicted protein [Sclerotinia sclerotiorum 1980 UF-70]|uniref:Uncharacterized protein n=1 Tax=Sclerotinia sclerotiorum (strain ATCC 18683 / 1980 / Ss-1) TaxID=665079 RepID=A7EJS3_SCLS1|nr:predicted protein [Sclerotinia sclerotiorum 1980 UF-70]EDO03089.1 predicted protein [Sclerotinia sclerotiorum 1980 UF-70]
MASLWKMASLNCHRVCASPERFTPRGHLDVQQDSWDSLERADLGFLMIKTEASSPESQAIISPETHSINTCEG